MSKKTLLTLFISAFLVAHIIAQKPPIKSIVHKQNTIDEQGQLALSLQIKQEFNTFHKIALQEYSYPALNGSLQLDRQVRYSYDPKGRHQNTLEYNGDGILIQEEKIHWDKYNNKNKTEKISYTNGRKVSIAVTYQLEYDEDGNKKVETYFNAKGKEIKGKKWHYNSQKEVKKSLVWIDNKKEPRKEICTTYKRHKNGDLFKSVSKEKVNGKIFRKDVRFFSNHYVIEWKKYINGKLESYFINEYRDSVIIRTTRHNKRKVISLAVADKQKERIEKPIKKAQQKRKPKESIWVTNTEYDAYGNILVSSQSMDNTVFFITQYSYDNYGNKIKTIKYDKEKDNKEVELLEYDKYGNISKKTIFKNNRVISEDIYVYEYFE